MDVFDDAPCCLHPIPCWLAFCWGCHFIRCQGACATEAAADIKAPPPPVALRRLAQG